MYKEKSSVKQIFTKLKLFDLSSWTGCSNPNANKNLNTIPKRKYNNVNIVGKKV